jgi:hypothetical protein
MIAEAHGYRIPYGSFPMESDNLNLAKSRMERTVKVTLPPGKGYDRGTFRHHIDALMGVDKLEACGPMAAGHIWQLTFVDNDSRDRFIAAGDFETPQGVTARVVSLKKQRYTAKIHWTPYYIPPDTLIKEFNRIPGIRVTCLHKRC